MKDIFFSALMLCALSANAQNSNQDPSNTRGNTGTSSNGPHGDTIGEGRAARMGTLDTDTETTRRIREDLMKADVSLAAKNVSVNTVAGKVTLSGSVASTQERQAVQETAARIVGGPNISNNITVSR